MAAGLVFLCGLGMKGKDSDPNRLFVEIAKEKKDLYRWIQDQTSDSELLVACDDVELYLYTGRQAIRPIAFSTEWFYTGNRHVFERDLLRMFDTARYIGATYWVRAADDYHWCKNRDEIHQRLDDMLQGLPVVYESASRYVRLYDISPMVRSPVRVRTAKTW